MPDTHHFHCDQSELSTPHSNVKGLNQGGAARKEIAASQSLRDKVRHSLLNPLTFLKLGRERGGERRGES